MVEKTQREVDTYAWDAIDTQSRLLPGVSRTFALTIPRLPKHLALVVSNAYLLCRIADTIEDSYNLTLDQKTEFLQEFLEVVSASRNGQDLTNSLSTILQGSVSAAEIDLIRHIDDVVDVTHTLSTEVQEAVIRCVTTMCHDMPKFQGTDSIGLKDMSEHSAYCYTVAGSVGEMLLDLFCIHRPSLQARREEMRSLAISFGQGLQMVNILKDIWDDRRRGLCWLPQSVFRNGHAVLTQLEDHHRGKDFQDGLHQLLGFTHTHLKDALAFTSLIPKQETGIRTFCAWAVGLAILTLRKIHKNPTFTSSEEVKISRSTVGTAITLIKVFIKNDSALTRLFGVIGKNIPLLHYSKS